MSQYPLKGLRIVDLTHVWAGPLGTRILGDLGADVVKVEAPLARGPAVMPAKGAGVFVGGEPTTEPWNRQSVTIKLNRSKRGVCIDLKSAEGKKTLLELVRVADVVIENFSALTMNNLGLGYEVLAGVNPEIIYVSMPGFGSYGPYSGWAAFGPSVEPMTGVGALLGYNKDQPRNSAMALVDAVAGVSAAAAVVTAVNRRVDSGRGVMVELTLHEAGISLFGDFLVDCQLGAHHEPIGNAHPGYAPHGIYPAYCESGDDEWIAIACPDQTSWLALRDEIQTNGVDVGQFDAPTHRHTHRGALDDMLADWTRPQNKHELTRRLQAIGVCAGAVNTAPDILDDEHLNARGYWLDQALEGQPSVRYPGLAIKLNGKAMSARRPAPKFGEHNREVLQDWLEVTDERVDELIAQGILLDRPPD